MQNSLFSFFPGEFLIAGIVPSYSDNTANLFLAAAVSIINKGVWDEDFVGEWHMLDQCL